MKAIITIGVVVVIMGGLVINAQLSQPEEVWKERAETATTTMEVVEELDVVEAAQAELDRINMELDAEEARLLEEAAVIESKLEKIRETRMSF